MDRFQKSMGGVDVRTILAITQFFTEKYAPYIEQSIIHLHTSIRGIYQVLSFSRDRRELISLSSASTTASVSSDMQESTKTLKES